MDQPTILVSTCNDITPIHPFITHPHTHHIKFKEIFIPPPDIVTYIFDVSRGIYIYYYLSMVE